MILVTMKHLRQLKYCAKGCRQFWEKHNISWADHIQNGGTPVEVLEETGDAMILKACELARADSGQE